MTLLVRTAFLCALIASAASTRADDWTGKYSALRGKYVTPGGVRYAAWKGNAADMQALQSVTAAIGSANISAMARQEQLAFYVNAYNAWILHEALAKYPT